MQQEAVNKKRYSIGKAIKTGIHQD